MGRENYFDVKNNEEHCGDVVLDWEASATKLGLSWLDSTFVRINFGAVVSFGPVNEAAATEKTAKPNAKRPKKKMGRYTFPCPTVRPPFACASQS